MRPGLSKDLIARVLGGAPKWTVSQLEEKFPPRDLPDGAMVTRVAPSPTGFMHLGTIYQMIVDKKLAVQSNGVFIMRIEDTDTQREIQGATDIILKCAREFGLNPNEGLEQGGAYGPYLQSDRRDIYHSVAAEFLARGLAYPCFLSQEEMDEIRETQSKNKIRPGIYGSFARDRNLSEDEIAARLDGGRVPSVRLYSTGDESRKIYCKDAVRGSIEFPENIDDVVIIKSTDSLPTYHFAHLVDDHFMRTTHVVRDAGYLSTFPLHVQMFNMIDWDLPVYIHTSTLDKIDIDTGGQRKLSKRKDPEASAGQFLQDGWPVGAVLEYLFNILNSGYEEDKAKGKIKNIWDAEFRLKKIPTSGALFDMKKLEWWAREFIAGLDESKYEITDRVMAWAAEYSPQWHARIKDSRDNESASRKASAVREADENECRAAQGASEYLHAMLNIERDNPKRIRKDFVTWKQTLEEVAYFFDDLFSVSFRGASAGPESGKTRGVEKTIPGSFQIPDNSAAQNFRNDTIQEFLNSFDIKDPKDLWWEKICAIAAKLGLKNGDVAMALRMTLTGRENTPDLYSIMQVMGEERVRARLEKSTKG
jgi:glutamyl-tRNA synthetase